MARKTGYENKLARFYGLTDGWVHLIASVIEQAREDVEDPAFEAEARQWLLNDSPVFAELAGMDAAAVKEEMWKRYHV